MRRQLLAGVMLLIPAFALAANQRPLFADVPEGAWYAEPIQSLAGQGIVNGYRDEHGELTGIFGPGNDVTLAEALKIAVLAAGFDPSQYARDCFTDKSPWYIAFECVSRSERIRPFVGVFFECYEGCTPAKQQRAWATPATRGQVAYMIAHAFMVELISEYPEKVPYMDIELEHESKTEIVTLTQDGVLTGDLDANGKPTGRFRPKDPINRAEMAKIAVSVMKKYGRPGRGRTRNDTEISPTDHVVNCAGLSFIPQVLTIKQGETVAFFNKGCGLMLIKSDPHPTHTSYPPLNAKHTVYDYFFYRFTFTEKGTFHYHDHYTPQFNGTIIVE